MAVRPFAEHLTRNNEGDDDGKVFAHAFKEDLHAGHDFNEFTLADVFEDHGDENRDDDSCRDAELDGRQTKVLSHNRVEREQEEERQNGEQSVDLRSFVSIVSFFLTELFAQRFKIRIKSFALVPILLSKSTSSQALSEAGPSKYPSANSGSSRPIQYQPFCRPYCMRRNLVRGRRSGPQQ